MEGTGHTSGVTIENRDGVKIMSFYNKEFFMSDKEIEHNFADCIFQYNQQKHVLYADDCIDKLRKFAYDCIDKFEAGTLHLSDNIVAKHSGFNNSGVTIFVLFGQYERFGETRQYQTEIAFYDGDIHHKTVSWKGHEG